MDDWSEIIQLIIHHSDEFEYDVENSKDYSSCDQCGNFNHNHIYNKK